MGSQLGYVVNNHGDRFRPLRIELWDPGPKWPNFMAYKWGVILTTYDTWEPILQVSALNSKPPRHRMPRRVGIPHHWQHWRFRRAM